MILKNQNDIDTLLPFLIGLIEYSIKTAWKVSKYKVFSGPYFSVFGPEKTPYLNTFHTM